MNTVQRRFYESLKSGSDSCDSGEEEDDEDEAQSKLLEQMLTEELDSGAPQEDTPTVNLITSPAKSMPTTPKAKQTPIAKTPSRSSPRTRSSERNRTPVQTSPTTRTKSKRARLSESASELPSITPASLGVFELNSSLSPSPSNSEKLSQDKSFTPPRSSHPNEELSAGGAESLMNDSQKKNGEAETSDLSESDSTLKLDSISNKRTRGRPRKVALPVECTKSFLSETPPLSPPSSNPCQAKEKESVPLSPPILPDVNQEIDVPSSSKSDSVEVGSIVTGTSDSAENSIERQQRDETLIKSSRIESEEVLPPPEANGVREEPKSNCPEEEGTSKDSEPMEIVGGGLELNLVSEDGSFEVNSAKSLTNQPQSEVEKDAGGKTEKSANVFSLDNCEIPPVSSTESIVSDKNKPEDVSKIGEPKVAEETTIAITSQPPNSTVTIQQTVFIPPSQQCKNSVKSPTPLHVDQIAFKVPRVPPLPEVCKNSLPVRLIPDPRWTQKFVPASTKEQKDDEELVGILKNIRSNIIQVPRVVSPLAESPEPLGAAKPEQPVEPKYRFPVLPRCTFNWSAKKLPIAENLNERLGAYLHPGVSVRVRFRRVGALKDIRSPDIVSRHIRDVANFAEAERRPKLYIPPPKKNKVEKALIAPTFEEPMLPHPPVRNVVPPSELDKSISRLPSAFNQPIDGSAKNIPAIKKVQRSPPPIQKQKQKEIVEPTASGKRSATVLFGSSDSS